MLLDLLDRLREKPEAVRFQIAFGVAGIVTFIIAAVWLITLQFKLNDRPEPPTPDTTPSFFGGFVSGLGDAFGEGRARLEELEEHFNSIEYQAPEDTDEGAE